VTDSSPLERQNLFGAVPPGLRNGLLRAFDAIVRNFAQSRWEPSELNGGKLCEAAYSIVRGYVDGNYPNKAVKPRDMVAACKALEASGNQIPRSFRIQVPRAIVALYEIRNNRGVGHAGADVDPNHMDALVVLSMAKWIVAEVIRILHQTDTEAAQQAVESLATRNVPIVWTVGKTKRVLDPSLKMRERMLVLLYAETKSVAEHDLVEWVEHSNPSVFRRDVLRPAHKLRLVEYDRKNASVVISPLGIAYVDDHLPLTITGKTKSAATRTRRRR
jgi:hypothetical protein